jgi:Tfp pilus assembly protein PilO
VSLTDRDRKIVLAIIPLLLIGVYWFFLLAPKRKEASKLETKVTAAQQAKDAALQQEAALNQAKSRFASQYSEMVRLGKAIPTEVDMPSLLVQLESAARGTGIEFGDIKVGARVQATPATGSSTTTTGSGTTTTGSGTTPSSSAASGSSAASTPNVAAGCTPAATSFGKATESANNAAATGNAQAAQQSGLNPGDTATSTAAKSGALPVGGGSAAAAAPTATTASQTGLDTVPLTFTFGGKFFNLADFFHQLKRFVHVANNKISVQGRLITIDSLKFTSSVQNFPSLEADVSATVYLSPKDGGTTAGATSQGPATSTPGATVQPTTAAPSSSSTSSTAPTATLTP